MIGALRAHCVPVLRHRRYHPAHLRLHVRRSSALPPLAYRPICDDLSQYTNTDPETVIAIELVTFTKSVGARGTQTKEVRGHMVVCKVLQNAAIQRKSSSSEDKTRYHGPQALLFSTHVIRKFVRNFHGAKFMQSARHFLRVPRRVFITQRLTVL